MSELNYIFFRMAILGRRYLFIIICIKRILGFTSLHYQFLSLQSLRHGIADYFCIVSGFYYFGREMEFTIKYAFFDKILFWFIKVSKCFSFVLHIRSDNGRVRINLQNLFLCFFVIFLRIIVAEMIILKWCSKIKILSIFADCCSLCHKLRFRYHVCIIIMSNEQNIIKFLILFQIIEESQFVK